MGSSHDIGLHRLAYDPETFPGSTNITSYELDAFRSRSADLPVTFASNASEMLLERTHTNLETVDMAKRELFLHYFRSHYGLRNPFFSP